MNAERKRARDVCERETERQIKCINVFDSCKVQQQQQQQERAKSLCVCVCVLKVFLNFEATNAKIFILISHVTVVSIYIYHTQSTQSTYSIFNFKELLPCLSFIANIEYFHFDYTLSVSLFYLRFSLVFSFSLFAKFIV